MDLQLSDQDIETLLGTLCQELGFCLPPVAADRIRQNPPLTADDFARAVLAGEGMPLELHLKEFRGVRNFVADFELRRRATGSTT